jgi:RNA polymerase sigma-70 factor (ECF subfamily)
MKEKRATGHQSPRATSSAGPAPDGSVDVRTLFRAHAAFVASFLRRLGTSGSDVDDLVQEVFLVAHRKGGYRPGTGQPRTWLGAIALRIASVHRRTHSRRHEEFNEEAIERATAHGDVAVTVDARKSLARVQRALDTLDLEHCAVFVLYEFAGESCEAIGVSLGIPVGTVYSRLHHARRRFELAHAALDQQQPPVAVPRRAAGGA